MLVERISALRVSYSKAARCWEKNMSRINSIALEETPTFEIESRLSALTSDVIS